MTVKVFQDRQLPEGIYELPTALTDCEHKSTVGSAIDLQIVIVRKLLIKGHDSLGIGLHSHRSLGLGSHPVIQLSR